MMYLNAALGEGMTIAEAARRWLKDKTGIRAKTAQGYETVFRLFDAYLKEYTPLGGSEVAALTQVTRQIASGFLEKRQERVSAAAISREFPAVSGLWRWAVRKGHTQVNPWSDMRADIKRTKTGPVEDEETKRAFTAAELVVLIKADAAQLAPRQGGYGPTMFDLIRLLLLTGARPLSIMSLTCGDVFQADDGSMALVIRSDKTPSFSFVKHKARRLIAQS
ncbi:MAG: site-specific integrase [Rhodospirillales bacterium]|nr:site-specific integrase [Rhodospirillales bacterium]